MKIFNIKAACDCGVPFEIKSSQAIRLPIICDSCGKELIKLPIQNEIQKIDIDKVKDDIPASGRVRIRKLIKIIQAK